MAWFETPLRYGVLAGASALALALAAPAMANELQSTPGSTVSVPQNPDVGGGYRPDPTRKTVGEMERDVAEGKYKDSTAPQSSGDMNRIGETTNDQPIHRGTPLPSGPGRPMGDATAPGSGTYGSTGAGDGQGGAFPGSAANLQVDRVSIEELPPDLQAAVRSRMDRQQTPNELVETTILNRLALMGSEYRLDSAQKVGANYVLRISNPDGQQATMLFETQSGTLREVQM
ncbi:MAG: hypothetical protein AB7R90_00510 [Reyranellaceae bacterium]